MSNNRDFYVYVYWRLDTNEPFYIGKGCGDRYKTLRQRSSHFTNIVNSIPITVEIVKDNLTEDEALGIECYLIHELVFEYGFSIDITNNRGTDGDYCKLVNATWGGEGTSGCSPSEETRKKISESKGIKVVCLNTMQIFNSTKDAGDFYGFKNAKKHNHISDVCNGDRYSCGRLEDGTPLVWVYYEDYLNITEEEINNKLKEVENNNYSNKSKVVCLNTNKIFDTMVDGANKYKCSSSIISQCCRGDVKSCGKLEDGTPLVWRYYKDYLNMTEEEIEEVIKNVDKRVICITTMKVFNTAKEGADFYGVANTSVTKCCKGKAKSSGKLSDGTKLVWMFYKDYLEQQNNM